MGELVRVAGTADLKPGQGMVAEVNGKSLAVFNVDGQFHVIDNTCVHRGGPLGEGELEANGLPHVHRISCSQMGIRSSA